MRVPEEQGDAVPVAPARRRLPCREHRLLNSSARRRILVHEALDADAGLPAEVLKALDAHDALAGGNGDGAVARAVLVARSCERVCFLHRAVEVLQRSRQGALVLTSDWVINIIMGALKIVEGRCALHCRSCGCNDEL